MIRAFFGFLLIAILSDSLPLFGQTTPPIAFSAKVAAGFSTSQIHGDQISGFNQFGGTFGAMLDMRRSSKSGMELGILWTQKGSRRPPDPKNDDYTTWQYRFSYIDIPLIRLWQPNNEAWWFGFGIQPSVLLGKGQADFDGNGLRDVESLGLDLHPVDLGGIAVLGIQISDHWDVQARLAQSLLPISPRPEQPVAGFNSFMMNLAIQWMLAWRF